MQKKFVDTQSATAGLVNKKLTGAQNAQTLSMNRAPSRTITATYESPCTLSDPLTADDVAKQLDKAAFQLLHTLMDVRQIENLLPKVKASRYLTGGLLEALAAELIVVWEISPSGNRERA